MSTRTTRGRFAALFSAVLTAAAAVGVVVGAGSTSPVAARSQEPMVIKAGEPVTKTFSGIPGNYPGTAAAYWFPSGCVDGGPASGWCDTIPLDIVNPGVDDATDWTVEIELTWTPTDTVENPAQTAQACDLAVWLFDDRQIELRDAVTDEEKEDASYTTLDSSDGATQPETVSTYAPALGRYNLVVLNFAGVNLDYTVKARMMIGHFEKPFEALAPTAPNRSGGDDRANEQPPPDFSADEPSAIRQSINPDLVPSPLGEVAVLPDQDFGSFDDGSSFNDAIRTPQGPPTGSLANIRLRPPSDVPPAVLAFWFLLVPAAVAGGAWVMVMRRRGRLSSAF